MPQREAGSYAQRPDCLLSMLGVQLGAGSVALLSCTVECVQYVDGGWHVQFGDTYVLSWM